MEQNSRGLALKKTKKRRTPSFSLRQQRAGWGCGWRAQAASSLGPTVRPLCSWKAWVCPGWAASDTDGTVQGSDAKTRLLSPARLAASLRPPSNPGAGLGPSTQPSRPSQTQPLTPSHPSGTASTGHLLFFTIPPIARPATTGLCIRHRPPRTRPVSCPHGIAIAHPRGAPPELAAAPEAFGWPGGRRLTGSIDAHQSTCLTPAPGHTPHTHTHTLDLPTDRPTTLTT